MKQTKRMLALLLALLLVCSALPAAAAADASSASGWEGYYTGLGVADDGFTGCFFLLPDPAFVSTNGTPLLNAAWEDETGEQHTAEIEGEVTRAVTPDAPEGRLCVKADFFPLTHQLPFSMPVSIQVPAGCLQDANGNSNETVTLTEFSYQSFTLEWTICSRLLQTEEPFYSDGCATGDTLRLKTDAWFPIDVLLDGKTVCRYEPGDSAMPEILLTEAGSHELDCRMLGASAERLLVSVIPSAQMYRKLLGDAAANVMEAPGAFLTAPIAMLMLPVVRLFAPILGPAVAIGLAADAVKDFFSVLFSFTRIYR